MQLSDLFIIFFFYFKCTFFKKQQKNPNILPQNFLFEKTTEIWTMKQKILDKEIQHGTGHMIYKIEQKLNTKNQEEELENRQQRTDNNSQGLRTTVSEQETGKRGTKNHNSENKVIMKRLEIVNIM